MKINIKINRFRTNHGRTPSERASQESGTLWDHRTCTPYNAPVLYAQTGHEMCAGPSISVSVWQFPCTSSFKSENCCNRGPTQNLARMGMPQDPTYLRITTNRNQKIWEAQKASLILCQRTPLVVFHPDAPEFSLNIITGREELPALPACAIP